MARDPLRGHLFENLVVNELMKARFNQGLEPRLYFYQVAGRSEVDLLFQRGHELVPIEIKSSMTFNPSFLSGIKKFRKIAPDRCVDGYVVYGGVEEGRIGEDHLLNYCHASQIV